MRTIAVMTLPNNKLISIITSSKTKEQAKRKALQYNKRLFADKSYHISEETEVVYMCNIDDYTENYDSTSKNNYEVAFLLNDVVQFLRVSSESEISAYKKVVNSYGIDDDIVVMIYRVNQKSSKDYLSSLKINETLNLISKAIAFKNNILAENKRLYSYNETMSITLLMVYDSILGRYNELSNLVVNSTISAISNMLNTKDNQKAIKEFINYTCEIKQDLVRYNKWTQLKKGDNANEHWV